MEKDLMEKVLRNIKLTIEYDGTNYHGWQRQDNAITVQEVLENCLGKLTGEDISVAGASRTDTGVHALGQTVNFRTSSSIPADKFPFAVNTLLPGDITVKSAEEADADFHSRFSTKGKMYKYLIYNKPHRSAIYRNLSYHYPYKIDLPSMKYACSKFVGTHDFAAFMATGGSVKTTVRTIYSCLLEDKGEFLEFTVSGNGFLYNMVRIMVGTVLEVGKGKISPDQVFEIIDKKDRKLAGLTVPPQGLYLVEVYY